MALRFLSFPSTFSTELKQTILSLHKPSKTQLSSSSSSPSSFSTSSSLSLFSTTKRKTNLLVFQTPSTTEHTLVESPTTVSEQEPKTRLIAQNIPWNSTAEDIKNLFQKHGNVTNVELSMYNKDRNRGLAFITMGSEEEALEALNNLGTCEIDGRSVSVAYAKVRKTKPRVITESTPKYDLFVANLSWKVKSKDLIEFFKPMNSDVVSAEVTYQMTPTRKPTGYGFVSFRSMEKAEEAIRDFQGNELMGKPVRLAFSNRILKGQSKDGISLGEKSAESNSEERRSDNTKEI
ncbi:hypothetical protein IFM89_027194 [Coptis chinensis]|uniref:RRM domain-containing protein n=1 Tax=Coptis chinensis TaxID=261450 RepID=A0A835M1X4_9MAGN|nr:hypothetical protein IFM89_027194 [Coptis chinensis]